MYCYFYIVLKKKNLSNNFYLVQKVDPEIVFTKQERMGKGSFGEVFKGIDNRTQQVRVYRRIYIYDDNSIKLLMIGNRNCNI